MSARLLRSLRTARHHGRRGRVVPTADNLVSFALSGPRKMIGVGNGDPVSHEHDVYVSAPRLRIVPLVNDWRMKLVPDTNARSEVVEVFNDSDWEKADARVGSGP